MSAGVALTFDDGLRSVFTAALPILRDHAVPVHLFLTTGAVGGDNRWPSQPASGPRLTMLSWAEVERLHAAGVRIESHTMTHPDLRTLSDDALVAECADADAVIARRLGRTPRFFAYPYGAADGRVRDLRRGLDRACLTPVVRPVGASEDAAGLPRLDSYYLRQPWLACDPRMRSVRAYLTVRRWARRLRGR